MHAVVSDDAAPVPTGVPGLDDILAGGYASNRAHLIEGQPGSGQTTLGLQFLLDGIRQGERCLYITLSESKRELLSLADRHGWSLDGLEIYELASGAKYYRRRASACSCRWFFRASITSPWRCGGARGGGATIEAR